MCQIFKFKQGRKKGCIMNVVFIGEKKKEKELDKKILNKIVFRSI